MFTERGLLEASPPAKRYLHSRSSSAVSSSPLKDNVAIDLEQCEGDIIELDEHIVGSPDKRERIVRNHV